MKVIKFCILLSYWLNGNLILCNMHKSNNVNDETPLFYNTDSQIESDSDTESLTSHNSNDVIEFIFSNSSIDLLSSEDIQRQLNLALALNSSTAEPSFINRLVSAGAQRSNTFDELLENMGNSETELLKSFINQWFLNNF